MKARSSRSLRRQLDSDAGIAMVVVLALTVVLGGIGATVALVATSNLAAVGLDRQSTTAQNVAEAGVAQGVAWLRTNGVGQLSCSPSCNPAAGQPDWGQGPHVDASGPNLTISQGASYGHLVTQADGTQFRVWIEVQSPLTPPSHKRGLYTVHSVGKFDGSASATGTRDVSQDLTVAPAAFPIGVFAHTVAAGGNGGLHYESLFSDSCIQGRSFETFQGVDQYYGVPAAAHSAGAIVPKQNDACTQGNSIHSAAACNTTAEYRNDTDAFGGNVGSTVCGGNGTLNGAPWLTTSKETSFAAMGSLYGFDASQTAMGLNNTQLDALRTIARQQGFYYTNTTAIPAALQGASAATNYPHPVLFYDLKGSAQGGEVDLKDLTGYSRSYPLSSSSASCTAAGAVVVVQNGNVKLNGNTVLVASVFTGPNPYGQVAKANGGGQLIGTLFADNIDMRGTADIYLDDCFLQNLPGGLLDVGISGYHETDR